MAYTFKKLASGNVEIYENGKAISAGGGYSPSYAAQVGYKDTSPAPAAPATQKTGNLSSSNVGSSPEADQFYYYYDSKGNQNSYFGKKSDADAYAKSQGFSSVKPAVSSDLTSSKGTKSSTPVDSSSPSSPASGPSDSTTKTPSLTKETADYSAYAKQTSDISDTLAKEREKVIADNEKRIAELSSQFETGEKATSDAYDAYLEQQTKYLDELKNQPSAVDALNTYREQQGLPAMEKELSTIDQSIINTETLLSNLDADLKNRVEGLPVSQAALNRLKAMEGAPLSKQLTEQVSARAKVAAGLSAKQQNVNDSMAAYKEDLTAKNETAQAGLSLAKENVSYKQSLEEQAVNTFKTISSALDNINSLKLEGATSDAETKQKLADAGFNYYLQQKAEKAASEKENSSFENELLKLKYEDDLSKANPGYNVDVKEDENGNYVSISTNKQTGVSTITDLGVKSGGQTSGIFSKAKVSQMAAGGLDEGMAETIYSEIVQGKTLDEIREELRQAGFSIQLLDVFDRVNDIRSIVEGSGSNKEGRDI